MDPSNKNWHIVPPDETRCVWKTAGVISYQLCDRELDCENCPLDIALRSRVPRPPVSPGNEARKAGSGREGLRDDRLYSANHCWAKRISSNLVQVGIEPGLGEALLAPKAIVFPSAGQRIYRGQTSLWIVMQGGTLPLECPLDGAVRSTNQRISGQPYLVSREPFDKGWLLELETETASLDEAGLMNKAQADPKYTADQDKFMTSLRDAASGGRHPVGITLADGGQRLQNIADVIGADKYFALLRKAFC